MRSLRVLFTHDAEAQALEAYQRLRKQHGEQQAEAWLEKLRAVLADEAELLTLIDFNRPTVRLYQEHNGCHVLLFRIEGVDSDIWQLLYERTGNEKQEALCVIGLWRMTNKSANDLIQR